MFTSQAYEIFSSSVSAVQPQVLIPAHLYIKDGYLYLAGQKISVKDINRLVVIAAGKAASAMAKAAEIQAGQLIKSGLCITKYGHSVPLEIFQTLEAGHPVPDANCIQAGAKVLETLAELTSGDIVLVLLSGGASSLVADLVPGCSLEAMQQLTELLINSGAGIQEINCVRKHLSRIKGGQLAKAAYPAKIYTLIISDVVGDDPGTIASGPTVPDASTFEEAFHVLEKYDIWNKTAASIRHHISRGLNDEIEETPKPGSGLFINSFTKVIGNNRLALSAAKLKAEQLGYETLVLTDTLTGDTELASRKFVNYLLHYNGKLPACILLGGETTLKVTGDGKGGRNQHFVLCAISELLEKSKVVKTRNITILGAGTDGTDGPTDAAGAVYNSQSQQSGEINKTTIESYLNRFDAYHFFAEYGGLVKTRPTQTNVMDIAIGLVN